MSLSLVAGSDILVEVIADGVWSVGGRYLGLYRDVVLADSVPRRLYNGKS